VCGNGVNADIAGNGRGGEAAKRRGHWWGEAPERSRDVRKGPGFPELGWVAGQRSPSRAKDVPCFVGFLKGSGRLDIPLSCGEIERGGRLGTHTGVARDV
jgi:hypothetical protein